MFSESCRPPNERSRSGDRRWREELDRHDELVRRELVEHGGREIKTTGDGFLAVFDAPTRAIRCAVAIREGLRGLGIDVRIGLHTGEVELRGEDVGGIAVNIGSRVADEGSAGRRAGDEHGEESRERVADRVRRPGRAPAEGRRGPVAGVRRHGRGVSARDGSSDPRGARRRSGPGARRVPGAPRRTERHRGRRRGEQRRGGGRPRVGVVAGCGADGHPDAGDGRARRDAGDRGGRTLADVRVVC